MAPSRFTRSDLIILDPIIIPKVEIGESPRQRIQRRVQRLKGYKS